LVGGAFARSSLRGAGRPVGPAGCRRRSRRNLGQRRPPQTGRVIRLDRKPAVAQRKAIDRVYAQIASATPAQTFVTEFYRAASPFQRAQTESVAVEVKSVLATSDRTYEIEWDETTRDLYGAIKSAEHWKGSFTIAINPPKDERNIRINPLGLYIVNASWTKVL
jgi:type IV secretory pathway TrbF-like protein